MSGKGPLLKVTDLETNFHTYEGVVKALQGVSFSLMRGKTLGIVGETGSGKSTAGKSILRLIPKNAGEIAGGTIDFEDKHVLQLDDREMREIRGGKISMIFQQPTTSLNPVYKIGDQIAEAIELHQVLNREALEIRIEELERRDVQLRKFGLSFVSEAVRIKGRIQELNSLRDDPPEQPRRFKKRAALDKSISMLRLVGIPDPERIAKSYPHQLSGGMQQRSMIAMALSCNPLLLIADEPTTALDVTIQAQILELLKELKQDSDLSMLLITHNLGIVAEMCDEIVVMYAGRILEHSNVGSILKEPKHPYTIGLIKAIPKLGERQNELYTIEGTVPNLINPPIGCSFYPRCERAMESCKVEKPVLREVEKGHNVACFLYNEGAN